MAGVTFATAKPQATTCFAAWRWWRGHLSAWWRTRTKPTAGTPMGALQPKRAMADTTNPNFSTVYYRQLLCRVAVPTRRRR